MSMKKLLTSEWKRIILCSVMAVLVCFGWKGNVEAANTDTASAKSISFGTSYNDSITNSIDNRFYKIELPTSGKISIEVEGDINWLRMYVYDSKQNQIYDKFENRSNITNRVNIDVSYNLTGGSYYIEIENSGVGTGKFSIKVDFSPSGESFSESGDGNNNDIRTANTISFAATYVSQIARTDGEDFFKFSIPASGKVRVVSEGDISWLHYNLYDSAGKQLYHDGVNRNDVTNRINLDKIYNLEGGTYYFAIENSAHISSIGCTGICWFNMTYTSANESFVETGADDYMQGANEIQLGINYNGQLAINHNDEDYYKFSVAKTEKLIIDVMSEMYGAVYLYDTAGNKLEYAYYDSPYYKTQIVTTVSRGIYYLRFMSNSRCGNYSFKISKYNEVSKPGKVSLSSVKSSKKKTAVIKWKKINNADGYQIQYAKSKKFKGKKTVYVSGSYTKKTITKLNRKKRYYVRVRAYKIVNGSYKYGKWSSVKSVKVK